MTTMGRGHDRISPGEAEALALDAADPMSAAASRWLVGDGPGPSLRPERRVRAGRGRRRLGDLDDLDPRLGPVAASLAIFDEVEMPAIRARSVSLTGYLELRLDELGVEVITPRDPAARGAQLSVRFGDAGSMLDRLAARGVVVDHRAPDIVRVAPIPLYTSYHDVWQFAEILRETIAGT